MPGTLFADIATPRPVPQMRRARSTSPLRIFSDAAMATCGYAVLSEGEETPTSVTEATRGWEERSVAMAVL